MLACVSLRGTFQSVTQSRRLMTSSQFSLVQHVWARVWGFNVAAAGAVSNLGAMLHRGCSAGEPMQLSNSHHSSAACIHQPSAACYAPPCATCCSARLLAAKLIRTASSATLSHKNSSTCAVRCLPRLSPRCHLHFYNAFIVGTRHHCVEAARADFDLCDRCTQFEGKSHLLTHSLLMLQCHKTSLSPEPLSDLKALILHSGQPSRNSLIAH